MKKLILSAICLAMFLFTACEKNYFVPDNRCEKYDSLMLYTPDSLRRDTSYCSTPTLGRPVIRMHTINKVFVYDFDGNLVDSASCHTF